MRMQFLTTNPIPVTVIGHMDTANFTANNTKINIEYWKNVAIKKAQMCQMLM